MSSSTLGICSAHPLNQRKSILYTPNISRNPRFCTAYSSNWNNLKQFKKPCLRNAQNAYCIPATRSSSTDPEGAEKENENRQAESTSSNGILKKLKRYGISGILSYGILNTVYYLGTFLVVWFYIVPAPGNMGYFAAVERFLKLMAMVWAGSQVTKLIRAGGALALAPFVDKGLSWFTSKFKFESQGKAFMAIVGFCLGLAIAVFLIVTLLCA